MSARVTRRAGIALLVALLLGTLAWAMTRVAQRGRFSSAYSSFGAGPDGTRALYRLTQELGFTPQRMGRELSHLSLGTLIAVGGCQGGLVRELMRPERDELLRWVEAGGLLIVAGVDDYVPEASGLSLADPATCRNEKERQGWFERAFQADEDATTARVPFEILAIPTGPPLAHALPFVVERARTVRVTPGNEATSMFESDSGSLGMTAPLGRGRVVLLGIPEALTNRALEQGGAALFARVLTAFAPRGPVWFDEYHLGMGERRSLVRYLRDRGHGAWLLQAALVIAVALLARAVRLGRAEDAPRAPARNSRDYLSALGALYERSGDQQGALKLTAEHALMRIARRYRAPHGVSTEQLPAWLDATGFRAAGECARHIREYATLPLENGESLLARARRIEQDEQFALALAHTA